MPHLTPAITQVRNLSFTISGRNVWQNVKSIPVTIFLRLHLCLRYRTNNTHIG